MAKKGKKDTARDIFQDLTQNDAGKIITGRILIVCEGTKTEPNYFRSFDKTGNGVFVCDLDCIGTAKNTRQVVEEAIALRDAQKKGIPYDSVWAVFDKDSFSTADFNAAIQKAHSNGIGCAWSNEAFEIWYIFHFLNRTTGVSRTEHQKILSAQIKKFAKGYTYKKNQPDMRATLNKYGDESMAIRYAEKQASTFISGSFAEHNPCTMVYKLVRLLRGEDSAFNAQLRSNIES